MKKSISQFILKIIAILTMILDHLGAILYSFDVITNTEPIYYILRILGRISFPLFAFFILEGVLHTRSKKNYLMRFGVCAVLLSVSMWIIQLCGFSINNGNIFWDLFFGATSIVLFTQEGKKKWWGLLPSIFPIFSQASMIFEYYRGTPILPNPILCSYGVYGYLLIMGYYLAYCICNKYAKIACEKQNIDWEIMKESGEYRKNQNLFAILSLFLINLVFFVISRFSPSIYQSLGFHLQDYSILAGAFLLFYSGKRGYNSKWFQYGCYAFYPLHLILLYGIIYLIVQ